MLTTSKIRGTTLFIAAAALTVLVYLPGLAGPFLFDDLPNLIPVNKWLAGELSWQQALLENTSGPAGRPVAMATFMLSASLQGFNPFAFKLGNVALHVLNGGLVYVLLKSLAAHDSVFRKSHATVPLLLSAAWLLHPLLVSTVLYSVQRMAILSATFVILTLIAYIKGREALGQGDNRKAGLLMFGATGGFTLVAVLCKESGAIAPLLCAIIEACYFRGKPQETRSPLPNAFILLFVLAPIALVCGATILKPNLILAGYDNRPFTLGERLMTQPRVLMDYAGSIIAPWGPRLTLYRDNYLVSTGLTTPLSTIAALGGWAAILACTFLMRKAVPAAFAGINIFLVGHLIESSAVPLLMYFEHRNYLPSIGIIWALGGIALHISQKLLRYMNHPKEIFAIASVLLIFTLAAATNARAWIWRDKESLFESSLQANPDSRWLRMEMAQAALDRHPRDYEIAEAHYRVMLASASRETRQIARLGLAALECDRDGKTTLQPILIPPGTTIEADLFAYIHSFGTLRLTKKCEGAAPQEFARELRAWLDQSPQKESILAKWRLRYLAALLFAADGDFPSGRQQASIAWGTGKASVPVGVFLVQLQLRTGRLTEAKQLIPQLRADIDPADDAGRNLLDAYSQALGFSPEAGKASAGTDN